MKNLQPRTVRSMDEWLTLKAALSEKGYALFQTQYSAKLVEGYHAWFITPASRVEVITHNIEVQQAIVKYRSHPKEKE